MKKSLLCIIIALLFLVGCSEKSNKSSDNKDNTVAETKNTSNFTIETELMPIDYREGYLIVQKSEDVKLYGMIDRNGNVIIEPSYDKLLFTRMNNKLYVRADLEGKMGILNLNGKKCIDFQYKNIVSAGDLGWLAENENSSQLLLDGEGKFIKKLKDRYCMVVNNKYLRKSKSGNNLMDGVVKGTLVKGDDGDFYDLDENLLVVNNMNTGNLLTYSTGYKDLFLAYKSINGIGHFQLIDLQGNVYGNIGTGNDKINDIVDDNILSINISEYNSQISDKYDCLSKGFEPGTHYFSLEEMSFIDNYSPKQKIVKVEKSGTYYRVMDNSGNDVLGELIKDYNDGNNFYVVENTDGQCAMINKSGDTIISFSKDIELYEGVFTYKGEVIGTNQMWDKISSNEFGFFYKDSTKGYKCHIFNLN